MNGCEDKIASIELWLDGELSGAESEAQRVDFMPFWRAVQLRVNEKRPWYQDALDWMRGVLPASRVAWVVPAVIVLLLAGVSLESYWRGGAGRNAFATVESIDAYGRNVALLREYDTKTTVIWLYQDQEGENEAAEESAPSGPAF